MKNQAITQVIKSWEGQNKAIADIFSKFEEDRYLNEVAPGRNRGIYLLGHLAAISDLMLPLLGLGSQLYPGLEAQFVTNPDAADQPTPSIAVLKDCWETINQTLAGHFASMEEADWLSRHTKVSEEDFLKDPSRNKLNVLISRTGHINYHRGQLAFLTPKV